MALLRINEIRVGVDRMVEVDVGIVPEEHRQRFMELFMESLAREVLRVTEGAHITQQQTQQEREFWRTEDEIWTEHLLCRGRDDYRYRDAESVMDMLERDMALLLERTEHLDD